MDFNRIIHDKLEGKAFQIADLPTAEIAFTEDVVAACKRNYCGKYNTCWTCPPGVGNLATLKQKYQSFKNAVIFTTKHTLEDSFDIEGMNDARLAHEQVADILTDTIREYNAVMLGAGSCDICEKCSFPDAPCRFPDKAKPSVEACGIDVVALSKTANINYHNGANTVTYFSVIFHN